MELLLELAPDPGSLPFFGGPRSVGAMSAGRSFHSVSGRWFWKDWPDATLTGGLVAGGAPLLAAGGVAAAGGGIWLVMGGRLMTAAVVLVISGREMGGVDEGRALSTEAPTGLETTQAESGRSLR